MSRIYTDGKGPEQPKIPPAPKRQVFLMPVNLLDSDEEDVLGPAPGTKENLPGASEKVTKAIKKNARRNYGMHSSNTALLPKSSTHSRVWLYRRFYEPIELQVETLSAVVARIMFVIWYLALIAALVLSVIPEAQWMIRNFCDLSSGKSENLKHLNRWQSTCMTVTPSTEVSAVPGDVFNVKWTGTGFAGNWPNLERFRRLVISLPTPAGLTEKKKTYALTARVEAVELSELVTVLYKLEVVCRRGQDRCKAARLPEELLAFDKDGSSLKLELIDVPAELAAPLSPSLTGYTSTKQTFAAVGIASQKRSYSLGTIVWRYIFMFLTLLHFIRFLANRKFTSTLYEQSWVLILQLALFWYMNPLIALNVTMRPVPSVLSFIEFRIPTYFFAITLAFMFAVMTASMTWKRRSDEPSASYMRKYFFLSKNVYAPPNWTKLAAGAYIVAVFVLDIVDASVYPKDWISGSNGDAAMSPIYWTVMSLLLFGAVVCLVLLYYLRSYLGTKPYLESRPQQLACRVFLTIFLSAMVFYIIHCFVFFLHYNRSYLAVYARQPFLQFPALMVAPMLVNIMTLVYTTRNRNESVPVLATDNRWKALVWPDSWYRWLARHGGSQYIFSSEEEETKFYRLQFQFRCRQLMAHIKKKQKHDRQDRRARNQAYSENDESANTSRMDLTELSAAGRGGDGDAFGDGGGGRRHTASPPSNAAVGEAPNANTNNSFGSFTLSALPSFVLEGLRDPNMILSPDATLRAAALTENSALAAPAADNEQPEMPQQKTDSGIASLPTAAAAQRTGGRGEETTHDPASYATPPAPYHTASPARRHSTHSNPASQRGWGATARQQDPLAQTYSNGNTGGGVGVLPGKMGRQLLNMDRFSTYYLPSARADTTLLSDSHNEGLAQTYRSTGGGHDELSSTLRRRQVSTGKRKDDVGEEAVDKYHKQANQGTAAAGDYAVVGPARHRSMLQQRAAAKAAATSQAASRNHSFVTRSGTQQQQQQHAGDVPLQTSDALVQGSGSFLLSPHGGSSPLMPKTSRWGGVSNTTMFLSALHQQSTARKYEEQVEQSEAQVGGEAKVRVEDREAKLGGANEDEPIHADDDDDAARTEASVEHLRSYEVRFPVSSDDESEDWWQAGATGQGEKKSEKQIGFFRTILNSVGSAVHTMEWHLIVNPARRLERWQDTALDAAYRPFDSTTYLPFFNLETAIDCYNMSWEAYGVKESAGDATIETGIKLAPENVPAAVKHGVSTVFCGCCAATESDEDDEAGQSRGAQHTTATSSSEDEEDDDQDMRFPEDIPEEEERAAREHRERRRSQREASLTAGTPSASTQPQHTARADAAKSEDDATTRVPIDESTAAASSATTGIGTKGSHTQGPTTDTATAATAPPPDVYPINVQKYGYELLFVAEIRDVQLIIVKMDTEAPEHRSKAPRIIISFRGTSNFSNAKYDVNLHRVVWKEMERAEDEAEMLSAASERGGGGTSIATTAASSLAAYTGCVACWKSCVRKTSWRPTVHAGFLSLWKSMQGTVLRELKKALVADAGTVYRVFTTGHSLGGALAALASYSITRMLLRLDYPIPEVTSYTYGQPRIGNRTFRNAYNKAIPRSFRIMNESDMVVTMTTFGGYHVGIEVDIDRNGNFIVKPTEIEKLFPPTRGRGLAVMNHLMSNYGISMNAIAKKLPCPARALMTYETADPEKRRREKLNDRRLNLYPPSEASEASDYLMEDDDGRVVRGGERDGDEQ